MIINQGVGRYTEDSSSTTTTTKTTTTAAAAVATTIITAKITTMSWTYNLTNTTLNCYMLSNRSVCPLVTTSNAFCVCSELLSYEKKLSYREDNDDDDGDNDADDNAMT